MYGHYFNINKMSDDYLIILNAITSILFVLSEILGLSSCEYNGVVHFIIGDCMCRKKVYVEQV
jgi:hypothetical protein